MRLRNESEKHLRPYNWVMLGVSTILLAIIFLVAGLFGLNEPLTGWRIVVATALWTSTVFVCGYTLVPARGFYLADFPCGTVGKVIILTVGFVGWPFFIVSKRKMESKVLRNQRYDELIEAVCRESEKVDREMAMEKRFPEKSMAALVDYALDQATLTGLNTTKEVVQSYVSTLKEIPQVQRISHYMTGEISITLRIQVDREEARYNLGEYCLTLSPFSKFELTPKMTYELSAELTETHRLKYEMLESVKSNLYELYRPFYVGKVDVLVKLILDHMLRPLMTGEYSSFEFERHYPRIS